MVCKNCGLSLSEYIRDAYRSLEANVDGKYLDSSAYVTSRNNAIDRWLRDTGATQADADLALADARRDGL